MSALTAPAKLSVEDYLDAEKFCNAKHEYIGGRVYAMAGTSRSHNVIASNLQGELRMHLRGGTCEAYIGDVKVRLLIRGEDIFYYPDIVVTCDSRDTDDYYLRFPKLIAEVLSDTTDRVDRGEKFQSYITTPTLEEYVLISQKEALVTIFRRRTNWEAEYILGLDAVLHLESVDFTLSLRALYENVRGIA